MTDGGTIPLEEARRRRKARERAKTNGAAHVDSGPDGEPNPPRFSDIALMLAFIGRHAENLRYVAKFGTWFEWTGTKWQPDDVLKIYDLARLICQEIAAGCPKASTARAVANAKAVAAVERLARAHGRVAARPEQWDADHWALNTPGGVIDLRSGVLRPHRREDYFTKCTAVAPGGECPRWAAFLDRVTGRDAQFALFLQRMCGYFLTGSIREHALFFIHGDGSNGKGVFVNTIEHIMGDYATTAAMDVFIAQRVGSNHPTELASFFGRRLVTAQENEPGQRWAESRIKTLTGGDRISARYMRQDFFQFDPICKLLIAGNHKPSLRDVDEAMRRRMNLIPFAVTIPETERDDRLPEKLREEWPGILQWMVDGCGDWLGEGLAKPEVVRRATEEYLAAENAIYEWIVERCRTGQNLSAFSTPLFKSWKTWAIAANEESGSQKSFVQALKKRGFTTRHVRGGTLVEGITLAVIYDENPRNSADED